MPFPVKGIFLVDPMSSIIDNVLKEVGLYGWPPFVKDRWFLLALAGGIACWVLLWLTVMPTFTVKKNPVWLILVLTIIWYPVLEEMLFRGVIQGTLVGKSWGIRPLMGLSVANWLTSSLFVMAHLWYQPALWAITLIAPSLVYGFFRDRYANIYPCIILHGFYNGGFVVFNLLSQ